MKPLRFGIVGTGNIAHRFARAIALVPDASLTAVASRTKEKAEAFKEEFSIPQCFDSYEAMAASDAIDVAYIAVPHGHHKECSILMMEHGKHVLCEKPMAVNLKEGLEMVRCAEKNRCFLMEAMWARFTPGTASLLQLVEEGTLGFLMGVEGDFCYALDPSQYDHHVMKVENGGGSLLDVGIYGLNFAMWHLGKKIEKIEATAETYNGVDSHMQMTLSFANNKVAKLSSAILVDKPNVGIVRGTHGYAKVKRFYAPEEIEIFLNNGTHEVIPTPYIGNGFENQIQHVCDCIHQGLLKSPVMSTEHSLYILNQMDTIREMTNIHYPQDDEVSR